MGAEAEGGSEEESVLALVKAMPGNVNLESMLREIRKLTAASAPHARGRHPVPSTEGPGIRARRILQFPAHRGLVIPDSTHQADIHQRIQTFPEDIADELRSWVLVLRGEGRCEHPAMLVRDDAQVPGLPPPGPDRLGESRHQPPRDHQGRPPGPPRPAAGSNRPASPQRTAQPSRPSNRNN